MKTLLYSLLPTAVLLALPGAHALAQQGVHFHRDVRPILASRCFPCHGPDLKKAGLDLQTREGATRPARSGTPAITPGKSATSGLVRRILAADAAERMPPRGEPLSEREAALLKAWIDAGAVYGEHWAYVPPRAPAVPAPRASGWARSPIDAFILDRLEREGLAPSPEADRPTLLRRVHLDLTGLPPSPAEVDAFLADTSPDAYDKAVERLLGSPAHGEHQARYWLDLARYADTNGYEKDTRRSIWPYRDWVIRAFCQDMPFDQFTAEQLAGDLLPGSTLEQRVATGFHRNTLVNVEAGADDEEFRVAAVVDRVNTTMEVWMGITMACAQCHNHKYDPFTQKEYYQLFAFFNSTLDRGQTTAPEISTFGLHEQLQSAALHGEITRLKGRREQGDADAEAPLRDRIQLLAGLRTSSTMVLQELPRPRPTHVLIRGSHRSPGEAVRPGTPARLHPMADGLPPSRLGLARWLTDPANPLTARVLVNRVWAQYFGRGLVETTEDFGLQGELPSHPELLDWLAVEVVRQRWSLRALHRLIVTSAAYRQASRVTPELLQRDPRNVLYARGPRFRLDGEAIRDNALAVSGLLNPRLGGPSVFPHQPDGIWNNPYSSDRWTTSRSGEQYRRGLYTFWRRTAPYASFAAFDAPSREVTCPRRLRTNSPLQALTTLNDQLHVEASAALARRVLAEAGPGEADRVRHGFRLCVAREPTARESALLLELLQSTLERYRQDAAAARKMAGHLAGAVPEGDEAAVVAAWTVLANVLLNLDETITKE